MKGNFIQALDWLKEGKGIRRPSWDRNIFCEYSKSVWDGKRYVEGIFFFENGGCICKEGFNLTLEDFYATDWEIFIPIDIKHIQMQINVLNNVILSLRGIEAFRHTVIRLSESKDELEKYL